MSDIAKENFLYNFQKLTEIYFYYYQKTILTINLNKIIILIKK